MKSAEITAWGSMVVEASKKVCVYGPLLADKDNGHLDVNKHSVWIYELQKGGLFMHPCASTAHARLTSTVFTQSINGGVGGRLLHVKAEDLKVLENTFDLESSLCCLSISWPKMSIS